MPFFRSLQALFLFLIILSLSMIALVILYPVSLAGAGDSTNVNYLRNTLELIYFFTNSIVAILAISALKFARDQIIQALRARTASIFSDLMSRWNQEDMINSRVLLRKLADDYTRRKEEMTANGFKSEAEYICKVLVDLRKSNDTESLSKHIKITEIFEYMGVLCRKEYVEREDLYDFFGGFMKVFLDYLHPYFLAVRREVEAENKRRRDAHKPEQYHYPDAIYSNALWLNAEMESFKPFCSSIKKEVQPQGTTST